MNESYERVIQYKRLRELCRLREISIEPECGDRFLYQGHEYVAVVIREDRLALADDLSDIPFDSGQTVCVENWRDDDSCFSAPSIERLLEIVRERTTVYPAMTPGVKEAKVVWQIGHPSASPIVCSSLCDGLLELAIRVLELE